MIGRAVGRFRIVAPLGKGGMASVWRARDELLGRDLALKILAEGPAQSGDARRRFRHEAHIASQLDHPGIAAVYDSGETEGLTWIAMALIDGETLSERIARSLVPVKQTVTVAIDVAEALGYAHSRGVVHRDVTARNIMLGRDGRVFVLDFGLALAQGASRISSSGTTVGTAPYMAPEVLLGGTADARSDLYGLGVVMYEALTGETPYPTDRPAIAAFAVLHQPLRAPHELRPEISPELEAAVLRCLARDPAARFADAGELAATLRAVAEAGGRASPAGIPTAPRAEAGAAPTIPRSFVAERLTGASGPVYIAIPPFTATDATGLESLARLLTTATGAALSRAQRVHVVATDAAPGDRSNETLREFARSAGANLVVLGDLRQAGSRVRITYSVADPEAGMQIAGDVLEGSALDPFELEDRLIASLRQALSRAGGENSATRQRAPDPVAADRFQQAARYMERHDHEASVDGAISILERLLEGDGGHAVYHATVARAYLFKYDLTKQRSWEARAATSCARAAELAPHTPETLLALGDLHRIAGRFADAEREYGLALAQRPDYFEARLGRARVLEVQGRLDDAEAECERAIASRAQDWRGPILLGRMRFSRGKFADALPPWERVVELVPDNALAARNLGSALLHLDRFDEALRQLNRSLELEPNAAAFSNLGTVYFLLARYDEAAAAFEHAGALLPTDAVNWGNLGNALRFTPGRQAEAAAPLERAVGLMQERLGRNPGDAEAWGRLAGWLANLGRHEEARAAVKESLRRGPEDVRCLAHAAHVSLQLGERVEALHLLRQAIARGHGVQALARSPDLESLRGDPEFEALLRSSPAPGRPA